MAWTTEERTVIGVVPGDESSPRERLLGALEQAYPVRFEAREDGGLDGIDALVRFGPPPLAPTEAPRLPTLEFAGEESAAGAVREVSVTAHPCLARPLWGATLTESHADGPRSPGLLGPGGGAVLATIGGAPAWTVSGGDGDARHHRALLAPAELDSGEALRSRLAPGRCLGVLALTQFLRSVCSHRMWRPPALRGAFVIDDPNLRRPTYGHIEFDVLARSAAASGYHVSIATVPLDCSVFHRPTVELFQEHAGQLSLCIHGNDHAPGELSRPRSAAEASVPAAQAVQRTDAFERRTGLRIDRVMVAPHEQLSASTLDALVACGYEAFCGTRPYPWRPFGRDLAWLSRPPEAGPLVGWEPLEVVAGLPALLRVAFEYPREELVYRAYLGQPLILYGHASLVRGGPGRLEDAARELERLGAIEWQSLARIVRGSFTSRRRGSRLELRMLGRRIRLEVPPGIEEVIVDPGAFDATCQYMSVVGAAESEIISRDPVVVRIAVERPGPVELMLDPQLDPLAVRVPLPRIRSIVRRIASEGRDRTRSRLAG